MAQQQSPVLKPPPGYRDPIQPPRPVPGRTPRPVPGRTPRPVPLPPSFQPHRNRNRKHSSFCRVFCWVSCILILVLIVVVALVIGVFFLLFDPRLPQVYLRSCKIPLFNTTTDKSPAGTTYLDAWTVPEMEVRNVNAKLDMFYSGMKAYVSLGNPNHDVGLVLGTYELKGFTQKPKNATAVKFDYVVKKKRMNEAVGKKLRSQYLGKAMRVGVEVKTRVGYVVKGWRIGTLDVDVLCGGVTMRELQNAKTMPKCTVSAYKW